MRIRVRCVSVPVSVRPIIVPIKMIVHMREIDMRAILMGGIGVRCILVGIHIRVIAVIAGFYESITMGLVAMAAYPTIMVHVIVTILMLVEMR
jgi:hypothetical protein